MTGVNQRTVKNTDRFSFGRLFEKRSFGSCAARGLKSVVEKCGGDSKSATIWDGYRCLSLSKLQKKVFVFTDFGRRQPAEVLNFSESFAPKNTGFAKFTTTETEDPTVILF